MFRTVACALVLVAAADAQEAEGDPEEPTDDDVVVTALRHEQSAFEVPWSTSTLTQDEILAGAESRSLPDALAREPSVLVQKTGPGQSSPFIRGFTGFRTLLLVDGVRLNNSVFRDGPNQYFGTVDLYSVRALELTRGPTSVVHGSDAIGGTLNALTGPTEPGDDGPTGRYATRWSSAEHAWFHRLEVETGEPGRWGARVGVTDKSLGDIQAGGSVGDLDNTSYDERSFDARVDLAVDETLDLTFVAQHVAQRDVPRTHKTVFSEEWQGITVGSELSRDLDQTRDLVYARAEFDGVGGFVDRGSFTLSWQRQQEVQDRRRTGDRFDTRGFDVRTTGVELQLESETSIGRLTYGFDAYHDEVDSFRRDFEDGMLVVDAIQGNVADDAEYDLFGAYVQDEIEHGDWETVLGLRYSHAEAEADRVDNPNVDGADPMTPGNILTIDEAWDAVVGSVRTTRHFGPDTNVYAGLSQGFRAPNLSDLTSDLEDSGIEQPTPDLDPEHFLAFETGVRARRDRWTGDAALWCTWIRDMIVRSPTGEIIDATPVVQKDNVGDGAVWGIEGRLEWSCDPDWTWFGSLSWMDGRVDQFLLPDGEKVKKPLSRLMPLTGLVGVTWDPPDTDWWAQCDLLMADRADRLSLRDEADDERIPPDGTPGYGVLGVRGGVDLDENTSLVVALENVLDKDHRYHGSGQNEPGRNLVLSLDVRF